MVFSSVIFLFGFLPTTLVLYYISPKKYRNALLLIASLVFYGWGEPKFLMVLVSSVLINWGLALVADQMRKCSPEKWKRTKISIKAITVMINIGILFIFKYLNFSIQNINALFGKTIFKQTYIALPIGISFITFQAMSYVFDVLDEKGNVQNNPLNVGLYISMFPQLIAGPIVRYNSIATEIQKRQENLKDFSKGIRCFIVGLGKKAILANTMAIIADESFSIPVDGLKPLSTWTGAVAYALQIYYDFSGYSDMAIGLGLMFAFHFETNFNYPYASKSISEFWRRWHISLGRWFRDYVYIPLGGSRVSGCRWVANLLTVWVLTGIWHGANWTFLVWGLWFFLLIVFEKALKTDDWKGTKRIFYRLFTILAIIIGWVLFRSSNLEYAMNYIRVMFSFDRGVSQNELWVLSQRLFILFASVLLSLPVVPYLSEQIKKSRLYGTVVFSALQYVLVVIIGIVSVSFVVSSTYNPFIYFNF